MTEIENIWKADAIEHMADDERVILAQRERIAVLEFHLEKLRVLIFDGYMKTAGIVPELPEEPQKPTGRKARSATT